MHTPPPEAPVLTVPLVNEWSQRPNDAFLHMTKEQGRTVLWISGMDLSNYESLVGPERADRHRQLFSKAPQPEIGFLRRLLQRL